MVAPVAVLPIPKGPGIHHAGTGGDGGGDGGGLAEGCRAIVRGRDSLYRYIIHIQPDTDLLTHNTKNIQITIPIQIAQSHAPTIAAAQALATVSEETAARPYSLWDG
jgi:hypothetical protein